MDELYYDVASNTIIEGDFRLIPIGWYVAEIKDIVVKNSILEGGSPFFKIQFKIEINRYVWMYISFKHLIRMQQLCTIFKIERLLLIKEADVTTALELIGKHLEVRLGITKSEPYPDKNEVMDLRSLNHETKTWI